jgi:phage/plasmid primase-like uncharacterized protein
MREAKQQQRQQQQNISITLESRRRERADTGARRAEALTGGKSSTVNALVPITGFDCERVRASMADAGGAPELAVDVDIDGRCCYQFHQRFDYYYCNY